MTNMGKLTLGFVLLMLFVALTAAQAYAQDVTVFIDGDEVTIPENKRLVLVPSHWTDEEIYREAHRAESVESLLPAPMPPCDEREDELVIGGAICDPG